MSIVKYRVRDVAADFGVEAKQIAQTLSKFFEKPRSNMQVLTEEQLNVLFDYMTQQNQISSIEQVFAEAMARRQELEPSRLPRRRRRRPVRRSPSSLPSPRSPSASASGAWWIPPPSP